MNRKGYTLIELLAVLAIIGIIFGLVIYYVRGTSASTMTQIDNINDNMIFNAAKNYVLEMNKQYNQEGYLCINTNELVEYGYIKKIDIDKIIKITRNVKTKVVEKVEYVDICE